MKTAISPRHRWLVWAASSGAGLAICAVLIAAQNTPRERDPKAVFGLLDRNRDGKISPAEFRAMEQFSPRMKDSPEQAEKLYEVLDQDGDRMLSAAEFVRINELLARSGAMSANGASTDEDRALAAFKILDANGDANGDGKLSRTEFTKISELNRAFRNNDSAIVYAFGMLDGNTDDQLTAAEFNGIFALDSERRAEAVASAGTRPTPPVAKPVPQVNAGNGAMADEPPTHDQIVFFESKIRPVLIEHCYKCHSADAEKIKGGLALDTREGIRAGGSSGHAVIPGDVEGSLLIQAIRYKDSDTAMPPEKNGGKLPDAVIADLERWIRMGAPDPRDGNAVVAKALDLEKGRQHWAFQLPQRKPAPVVNDPAWPRNEIDRHILAGLEAKGLAPVTDADKATLLRRVYFDLIGLPPTPDEVRAFVADTDPKAFEKAVDRLLASPQFGERWGRHWLDVARYAESSGKENNITYPHAWRYRDYVIDAFNADKPYDRFLKEQLAGDLLKIKNDDEWAGNLVATGYLAIGPKSHNTRNPRQFALDVADEQIDAIGQGMLGLTIACARCHDHKFDPVPQADYYAMAGIFLSTETRFGTPRFVQNNNTSPLIELPASAKVPSGPVLSKLELDAMQRQLDAAKAERDEVLAEARRAKDGAAFANPRLIRSQIQIGILEKLTARYDASGKPLNIAMGVQDRMYPRDAQLLARGELEKPMDPVPRGFVQVLATAPQPKIAQGSGRLELAGWIASPENPLTARVMANRVWLHLFGAGIVPTPDNFGTTGHPPVNQPLLDHLAIRFVENGWSVKTLIREIVLSRTYQLGSAHDAKAYAVDPDNTLHWRMSQRRLDAEALRDAMLAVAGKLDLKRPAASPVAKAEGPVQGLLRPLPGAMAMAQRRPAPGAFRGAPPANPLEQDYAFRSVYLPVVREQVPDSLETFDFAEPSLVVGARESTTVPSQALYLLNSDTVQKLSEAMAVQLLATKLTGMELAKHAFELAYSRPPTKRELDATTHFFGNFSEAEKTKHASKDKLGFAGLTAFCQALLGSAEFRILD